MNLILILLIIIIILTTTTIIINTIMNMEMNTDMTLMIATMKEVALKKLAPMRVVMNTSPTQAMGCDSAICASDKGRLQGVLLSAFSLSQGEKSVPRILWWPFAQIPNHSLFAVGKLSVFAIGRNSSFKERVGVRCHLENVYPCMPSLPIIPYHSSTCARLGCTSKNLSGKCEISPSLGCCQRSGDCPPCS